MDGWMDGWTGKVDSITIVLTTGSLCLVFAGHADLCVKNIV